MRAETDPPAIPQHVAIIMDGDRRWAKKRGLPVIEGYREGTKRIEPIVKHATKKGIKSLTFWAFSKNNWKREKAEVDGLMTVFREALGGETAMRMIANGARIHVIGDLSGFDSDIRDQLDLLQQASAHNERIIVNFALGYDGRDEIVRAANRMHETGQFPATEDIFSAHMDIAGQPDPDLVIRTSGENRLSRFMSWPAADSEIIFEEKKWPNYKKKHFKKSLKEYAKRERRHGK